MEKAGPLWLGLRPGPQGFSFLMPAHQTVHAVVKLSEGWLLVVGGVLCHQREDVSSFLQEHGLELSSPSFPL